MLSSEKKLRKENFDLNSSVCQDSCLELFIQPDFKNDKRYMNFEINPNGTILSAIGQDRNSREFIVDKNNVRDLNIIAQINQNENWCVNFSIPFDFIKKYYPLFDIKSNNIIKANFYKCGDLTEKEHYCCWNNTPLPNPDFHCPDFFGELVLE